MHAFHKLAPPTLRRSGKSDACSSEAPPQKRGSGKTDAHISEISSTHFTRVWKIRSMQFRSPAPKKRGSGKTNARISEISSTHFTRVWKIRRMCSSEAPPPKNVGLEKQTYAHSPEALPLRRSLYFSECRVWKTKPLPLAQNRRSLFCSIFHHCFIENRNYRAVIFIILHIHRESKL